MRNDPTATPLFPSSFEPTHAAPADSGEWTFLGTDRSGNDIYYQVVNTAPPQELSMTWVEA